RRDERHRQQEHLDDDARGQALAEQARELLRDLLDEHQRRERRQGEAERRDVLAQQVTADSAHDRWRHYIRKSKSLQDITTPVTIRKSRFSRSGLCLALALVVPACGARDRAARPREFVGPRAFGYLEQQMQFGPRIPGTAAHERAGDWIQQRLPAPGANDGASGVAVLLGVADALKAKPPTLGVDLLFVDGEDYGNFATDSTDVLIGSRYFAAHQPPGYQPLFAVLFDMVADKDQQFYYEGNSQAFAPEVVDRVWRVGAELGYGR